MYAYNRKIKGKHKITPNVVAVINDCITLPIAKFYSKKIN